MKTLGLVPFNIVPPQFGGAERCYNILGRIGVDNILGLSWDVGSAGEVMGVPLSMIPAGDAAHVQAMKLRANGILTFDAMPTLCKRNLEHFQQAINDENPDLIILEHPWLVRYIPNGVPYIYDSHNAEAKSFGDRFANDTPEYLHIRALEKEAVEGASLITYCSEKDMDVLRATYNVTAEVLHLPNGVALPDLTNRQPSKMLLFVGSVYQPNVTAAQRLVNLAPFLRDWKIVIAGGCANYVRNTWANVELLGHVTDEKLHTLFLEAYAFVNLVSEGSGTHLKIGRSLAYGVPVITTIIGARGYETVHITNGLDVPTVLNEISKDYDHHAAQARTEAETLTWDTITQPLKDHLDSLR